MTLLSEDSTVAEVLAVFESEGLALSSLRVHRPPSAQLIAFADGEVARFPAPSAVVCATWVGDAAAGAAACGGKGSVSRLFLNAASKPALAAAWSQPAESPATAKDTAVVLADSLAEARPVLVFRRPSLYAAERVASGKSVPNFLLPAGAPGHLPPHVALSRLEAEFAALPPYETVAAGDDGSSSPSPRTLVNDERDVPPHVRAVRLLEEIEARRAQSGVVVDGEGEAKVVKVKRALGACWRVTTAVLAVAKFVFSTVITIGAIALIYIAIGSNLQALPPHEVWAPVIHIPLLLFVITALAYLEGIQVRFEVWAPVIHIPLPSSLLLPRSLIYRARFLFRLRSLSLSTWTARGLKRRGRARRATTRCSSPAMERTSSGSLLDGSFA